MKSIDNDTENRYNSGYKFLFNDITRYNLLLPFRIRYTISFYATSRYYQGYY